MDKAYFYINFENFVVLKTYLHVIELALVELGYTCHYVKTLDGLNKNDLIIHVTGLDAFKCYFKGYKNYILWQQGVSADESYMKHRSKMRYWILNKIDLFSMKKAKFIFYVSEYMLRHYEKIGHTTFSKKSYIMPCFNEELDLNVFLTKDYSLKNFCYVGSLAKWQCFTETAELYKKIEEAIPNSKLKVLSFNVEEGKKILTEIGIKNFEIKQVPKEKVKQELDDVSFGFILREDNIVNRVATPTKISSYLSAGVIPIFSSCLIDFDTISKLNKMKSVLSLKQITDKDKVIEFVNQSFDKEKVKVEFEMLFSSYYSISHHYENIVKRLKNFIK